MRLQSGYALCSGPHMGHPASPTMPATPPSTSIACLGLCCAAELNLCIVQDAIYFAYFPPYSYVRHQELIARIHAKKNVRLEVIGETLDGYDLDVLRIGE